MKDVSIVGHIDQSPLGRGHSLWDRNARAARIFAGTGHAARKLELRKPEERTKRVCQIGRIVSTDANE